MAAKSVEVAVALREKGPRGWGRGGGAVGNSAKCFLPIEVGERA